MTADDFEQYDAAYVLGSLPDNDRQAFEAHMLTCAACRARVAELEGLPALLFLAPDAAYDAPPALSGELAWVGHAAAVPAPRNTDQTAVDGAESPHPAAPLTRQKAWWSRRGFLVSLASIAAASCVATAVAVSWPAQPDPYSPTATSMAFVNVGDAPFQAHAELVASETWEKVNLWCTYRTSDIPPGNYLAVVRGKSGRSTVIGSWPGLPGQTTVVRVPTGFHVGEIASIDITTDSGQTLSRLTL